MSSGHVLSLERGIGHIWAPQEESDGIVVMGDPVWFMKIKIGALWGSGFAGIYGGGMLF